MDRNRFNKMYGYGSNALRLRMCSSRSVFTRAQTIMTAKNANTKGHEPIMLRIRSADRSPSDRSPPDRTPGCLCQFVCQGVVTVVIVAHAEPIARDHPGDATLTARR